MPVLVCSSGAAMRLFALWASAVGAVDQDARSAANRAANHNRIRGGSFTGRFWSILTFVTIIPVLVFSGKVAILWCFWYLADVCESARYVKGSVQG